MKVSLITFAVLTSFSSVYALSLYDTAPAIGLAQNSALKYTASASLGYDSNINGSAKNKDACMFTRFGLGASSSDNDAMTRITWSGRVGGTIYTKRADGTNDKVFADINFALSMSHTINSFSSNNLNLRFSISPELDYSNGISGANREGDRLNWSVTDTYTRKLDAKKNLSFSLCYSGNIYLSDAYDIDDREYVSAGTTLSFKESKLTTYSAIANFQYDIRRFGPDSQNIYILGGVQRVLSEVSSVGVKLGAQVKFIDGGVDLYPNLKFSYRRQVIEGLSFSAYASLENENIDTYSYTGANYNSDMAWRLGGNLTQKLNSRMSLVGGYSIIYSQYSESTRGYADRDEATYNAYAALNYLVSESLTASLRYSYTIANKDAGDYDRNMITGSLSYSF